jgi:hypothetical protein
VGWGWGEIERVGGREAGERRAYEDTRRDLNISVTKSISKCW